MVLQRAVTLPTVPDGEEKSTSTTGTPARARFHACCRSRTVRSPLLCMAFSTARHVVGGAPRRRGCAGAAEERDRSQRWCGRRLGGRMCQDRVDPLPGVGHPEDFGDAGRLVAGRGGGARSPLISGGRGRSLFHVDEDLVATQEPGLERRVEPGEARCADRSQTCRGDGVEKFRAVTLVRRLRPATAIFLHGRETSWYRADLDIRVGAVMAAGRTKAIT